MKVIVVLFVASLTLPTLSQAASPIYSATAVGYTSMSLPEGLCIIANPFYRSGGNHLNNILHLPEQAISSTIYRFDVAKQTFGEPIQWAGSGLGWLTAESDPDWSILDPGEGVFIQVTVATDILWLGTIPEGEVCVPVIGGDGLQMLAPPQPREGRLQTILGFPSRTLDTVYIYDCLQQTYREPYQYLEGLGWLSANPDDEGADGPFIPFGTGFFLQSSIGGRCWKVEFRVGD